MEVIGVIGIVVGLVIFVIAAMKGWNVLITSLVAAAIIALTNGMDLAASLLAAKSLTSLVWPASFRRTF